MFIRFLLTIPFQIFCEFMLYLLDIFESFSEADDIEKVEPQAWMG